MPPDQAGCGGPKQQHHGNENGRDAAFPCLHAAGYAEKDHKEEEGQGHHEVREAHEHGVGAPPEEARGGAVGRAEEHIKQGREEPDEQGSARAVHEPGEHIPP